MALVRPENVNFLSGCTAGVFSSLLMHPVDSLKAQRQYHPGSVISLRGLYRGLSIVFLLSIPSAGLFFSSLYFAKEWLAGKHEKQQHAIRACQRAAEENPNSRGSLTCVLLALPQPVKDFLAGFYAQVVSSVVGVPRDVVKQRLQIQHLRVPGRPRFEYKSSLHAVSHIVKTEGFFKGLYRGWWPDTSLWGIYGGFYFVFFTINKALAREALGLDNCSEAATECGLHQEPVPLSSPVISLCAMSAATIAAALTNPIDVLRLHYVTRPGERLLSLIRNETRAHGYSFWWHGYKQRVFLSAPRTTISFTMFEYVQSHLQAHVRAHEEERQ